MADPIAIDGEKCLLACEAASHCTACADLCPHDVILIDDNGIGLVEENCTGCGQCLPACPVGAVILPPPAMHIDVAEGRNTAFAACHHATPLRGQGHVPCLHGISLAALVELAKAHVSEIALAFGDCATCKDSPKEAARLEPRLKLMRQVLESRGLASPAAHAYPIADWLSQRERAVTASTGISRRAFFARSHSREAAFSSDETSFLGLPPMEGAFALHRPVFSPERCTGCDCCIRLCPTGALTFVSGSGASAYGVNPFACNACGLCRDICDEGAITLAGPGPAHKSTLTLAERQCVACGAPFHPPKAGPHDLDHCRICAKTNHYANLHQVLS